MGSPYEVSALLLCVTFGQLGLNIQIKVVKWAVFVETLFHCIWPLADIQLKA